ncbi:PREDICTED: transmembrane emp24 domain-containing protein p24delta3-like [Nelumbo nucifera]|uniref:Transmembrane emp24 domain-containing protein p24delta3-like n=2 Tax=Nelumbo nucifera TaxID=4432 RepID=A0A1U8B9Q0_NELNU|nr:PREDICTED: transmembrane emp24 domain-containing protein p24delta3-like [Nelumbo nucifera]DAD39613.1 TPA_asm: hypothetical protein HUJ06_013936 [Nelumbo nucifera]
MMELRIPALFLLVSSMGLLLPLGEAIWLSIPPSRTKCVSEEIHNDAIISGDYSLIADDLAHAPTITAKVASPYGNTVYSAENVTHGHFAFTATEVGNYLVCFWLDGHHPDAGVSVNLDWKIGIAAKDWDSMAKKETIEDVELELKKLEAMTDSIYDTMFHIRSREAEMRNISEDINARVAWLSIMSLGICIVVSALQLWYLKSYFVRKRLI